MNGLKWVQTLDFGSLQFFIVSSFFFVWIVLKDKKITYFLRRRALEIIKNDNEDETDGYTSHDDISETSDYTNHRGRTKSKAKLNGRSSMS